MTRAAEKSPSSSPGRQRGRRGRERSRSPAGPRRRKPQPSPEGRRVVVPQPGGNRKGKIVDAVVSAVPVTHGLEYGWKVQYDDEAQTATQGGTRQGKTAFGFIPVSTTECGDSWYYEGDTDGESRARERSKKNVPEDLEEHRQIRSSRGLASLAQALETENGLEGSDFAPPFSQSPTFISSNGVSPSLGSPMGGGGGDSDFGGYSSYWDDEDSDFGQSPSDVEGEGRNRGVRVSRDKVRRALGLKGNTSGDEKKTGGASTGANESSRKLKVGDIEVTAMQARMLGLSLTDLKQKFSSSSRWVDEEEEEEEEEEDQNYGSDEFDAEDQKPQAQTQAQTLLRRQRGMRQRLSDLARHKPRSKGGGIAGLADKKECTFMPKISRPPASMATPSDEPQGFFEEMMAKKAGVQQEDPSARRAKEFIRRMDASLRQKRHALVKAQGEHEHQFKSKKICPVCGAAQTYDQLIKREKRCKNDGCRGSLFRPASLFNRRSYQERQDRYEARKQMKAEAVISAWAEHERAMEEAKRAHQTDTRRMLQAWRQRLEDMGLRVPGERAENKEDDILADLGMATDEKGLEENLRRGLVDPDTISGRPSTGTRQASGQQPGREKKAKLHGSQPPYTTRPGQGKGNSKASGNDHGRRKAAQSSNGAQRGSTSRASKEKKAKKRAAGGGDGKVNKGQMSSATGAAPDTGSSDPRAGGWGQLTLDTFGDEETPEQGPDQPLRSPWGSIIRTEFDEGAEGHSNTK